MSDDMEMKAIVDHFATGDAAVRAILGAGCDLLLICASEKRLAEAREALVREADRDAAFAARLEEAIARVDGVRAKLRCAPGDDDALAAAFASEEAELVRNALRSIPR
ncbi:MAG: hypothetical protein R3B82_25495 [Sandaracinaceae bacterium]